MSETAPQGVTGLALAEHYLGPLLSPVATTPAQWTAYTEHRRFTNARYKNVFVRRKRLISDIVAVIEGDLGLDGGTLQKCVSVMWRNIEWDDDDVRDAEIHTRIYSPAAPKYIDVHIKYHCRPGVYDVDWHYSLGYRINHLISDPSMKCRNPSSRGIPPTWHARGGWQPICWGYYADDSEDEDEWCYDPFDYDDCPDWRRIEEGKVELHREGVLDIYQALFGPIGEPPSDDAEAILQHRTKLVATVRLLLAAVGIDYRVACTDAEWPGDVEPEEFMLEGLSDRWVARGIREACGFQLSGDPEAAALGEEERREEAEREREDDEEDEDEDEDEDGFSNE